MEDPIDFDVWCRLQPGHMKEAAAWTAKMHGIALVDAYKSVQESSLGDGYVQIYVRCGWSDIPKLRGNLPDFAQKDTCAITESSYRPAECPRHCLHHSLRYAIESCPICSGFYIDRVVDGKRIVANTNGK